MPIIWKILTLLTCPFFCSDCADIVLALVPAANVEQVRQDFQQQGCRVLATALDLYRKSALFEINPLAVRENGDLVCVDAKINIDENAAFR